jgi:hypothetical protein
MDTMATSVLATMNRSTPTTVDGDPGIKSGRIATAAIIEAAVKETHMLTDRHLYPARCHPFHLAVEVMPVVAVVVGAAEIAPRSG